MSEALILITEDYQDSNDCLAAMFQAQGFVTDQAKDIREAVAMFNVRCADGLSCYDAAILDVHLPSASGLGFLRAIREVRSRMPIFMVTAYDDDYIKMRIQQQNASYNTKPIDPKVFIPEVVKQALDYHTNKSREVHPALKLEAVIIEMMDRVEQG